MTQDSVLSVTFISFLYANSHHDFENMYSNNHQSNR